MIDKIKQALLRFRDDKRGIVTLWAIVFIGMAIYMIAWFTVGLPLVYFIDAVRDNMTENLTATGRAVIDTVMFAFEINPVIALAGWFIYGFAHSAKKETDLYRAG